MNNTLLVSIIIPVFNVQLYLAEALDSVVKQTYENLEIIIVDDGSTDGSGKICDEYAKRDRRIIVIHQENKGLSAARNAGLDIMTGSVVAFLDPDDAYCHNYISSMMEVMDREKVDLVICKYTTHYTDQRMSWECDKNINTSPQISQGKYNRNIVLRALADGKVGFNVWNKLYKGYLWKDIRFPVGHVYEDIDTIFRIIDLCKTIYVMNNPLYLYRKRQGSITERYTFDYLNDWNLAQADFESYISENTPEVFRSEQLRNRQRIRMNKMLYHYGSANWAEASGVEVSDENLRRIVIE